MATASPLVIQAAPARRAPARRAAPARRHHKAKFRISLLTVAGMMPTIGHIKERYDQDPKKSVIGAISKGTQTALLGYNPDTKNFNYGNFKLGLIPLVAGVGLHMIMNKTGVNRRIQKAIPFISL